MSTSLAVVAFTKDIIINRAELSVEDSPIEFTGTDNFLIVNSIVPQPLTTTKTVSVFGDYDIFEYSDISYPVLETTIQTNDISEINLSTSTNLEIPIDVDYFSYSSVNDEALNDDITIKSQASISFGEDPIENGSSEIIPDEVTVDLDTETEKTVLWGNIVKFTANAAQAASTVPYTITGITSEELNDAPLTGFMDLVAGTVEKEFLLTPKNNTTIEDFTFSIVLNQQTTLSVLLVVRNTISLGSALYAFTDVTFSPGGATGRFGPSLTQAKTGLSGPEVATWKDNTAFFNTSNGIQLWTVPKNGTYRIEAWGAQGREGGQGSAIPGGLGAHISGDFLLNAGQIIRIIVGQQGGVSTGQSGGGGGGSYVLKETGTSTSDIFVIAGGGGGAQRGVAGSPGSSTTSATGGNLAAVGFGGNSSGSNGGAGGAGWESDGANGQGGADSGGKRPANGSNGGIAGTCAASGSGLNDVGGFGGGGGGEWCAQGAGGGGGGYTGGSGSNSTPAGGGGGSFNSGTNQSNSGGVRSGAGQVIITSLDPEIPLGLSGPETATFGDTLTYQFLYSPGILADGTNLAYTITGIDSDSIVGNTLSGTIKVYDDGSFLIIKLEDTGITGTLTLTVTLPDNSTETVSTEIISSGLSPMSSGGTITTVTVDSVVYVVHTFIENGVFIPPGGGANVEMLVVAGGGSGGNHNTTNANGGGGAGGLLYADSIPVSSNTAVAVGAGGARIGDNISSIGNKGNNSSFGNFIAQGGGGGGSTGVAFNASLQNGGSAGGVAVSREGTTSSTQTNIGTAIGYGNRGGITAVQWTGAGGGGAGGAGVDGSGSSPGGNGGNGLAFSISGITKWYAGGGGGGANSSERAGDGYHGGGRGAGTTSFYAHNSYPAGEVNSTTLGSSTPDALVNSGGGGGAGSYWAPNGGWTLGSGQGGSGVVIVRYAAASLLDPIFGSSSILAGGDAQSYTYTDISLPNNTTLTYSISNISASELIGIDATGTLTIKDGEAALAFKVASFTPQKNIVLTITAPGDTPATKDIAITRVLSYFTAVTPTVISTTFEKIGQPESTPTLSMFSEKTFYIDRDLATFSSITNISNQMQIPVYIDRDLIETQISSKEIMIDLDELTFSLIRIVPVSISIGVRDDQELGFFVDSDGKASFAVLDDSNDPRAIQIPGFGTGPVQRWF